MNAKPPSPETAEYRCPGERQPISRAVHLGRLASFYPACRQCHYRDDTGTLSPRLVQQLQETQLQRGKPRSLFHEEGAGGVYLNDLTPADARNIAAAFGIFTLPSTFERGADVSILPSPFGRGAGGEGHGQQSTTIETLTAGRLLPTNLRSLPGEGTIVLAGDGRPVSAELVAAASEGLQWAGCDVLDIGPATSACLAFTIEHLHAVGGLLVGNPESAPHTVGLSFWTAGARPLSAGGTLEPLIDLYQRGANRPTRTFGSLQRHQADTPYLDSLAGDYHGLRPLRVVVDSASAPWMRYLEQLTASTACRIIPRYSTRDGLANQVRKDAAHFAARIDGDGETCHVFDEQGRPVPPESLLRLLIRRLPRAVPEGAAAAIVLENSASQAFIENIAQPLEYASC